MLRDLGLQSLQNRRKQQWLTLFFKIVRRLTPAIPANEFLTPINSERLIKSRNPTDFKTTNIVIDHARNYSESYRVHPLFRYPFHPRVTAVASKRPRSFCQKCRWQVTAKHVYTLRMWLCMMWHGCMVYTERAPGRLQFQVAPAMSAL